MSEQVALFRLAIALAIGVLIGMERHWREREAPAGGRVAGIRTFGLSSLLGGVAAVAGHALGAGPIASALLIGFCFLGFAAAMIAFGLREARGEDSYSATTTIAGLVAFALGALAGLGAQAPAVAAAVAVTALLAYREPLHGFVRALEWRELRAAITVLVMTFLILPFIPDRAIDPWGGVNPRELWILAILTALLSFAGYVAVKAFGAERGLMIAGAAGGLSSSTAVTLAFSRQAKAAPQDSPVIFSLAAGAVLAGAASAARAGVIAIGLAPVLIGPVGTPLLVFIAVTSALAWGLNRRADALRRQKGGGETASASAAALTNPFDLIEILRFTLFLALVFVVVRMTAQYAGGAGAVVTAAITGSVDVHAVAAAIPALIHAGMSVDIAAWAVLASLATSTIAKAVLAWTGGPAFSRPFGIASALALAAAAMTALAAAHF